MMGEEEEMKDRKVGIEKKDLIQELKEEHLQTILKIYKLLPYAREM